MDIELKLGDKVWMHYGPSVLVVGHIIDHSPDFRMVGLSPLPFENYKKMTCKQKASCPITWCETRACHYLCHITHDDLVKADELVGNKGLGFLPLPIRE